MSNVAVRTWDKIPGWGQFILVAGTGFIAYRQIDRGVKRARQKRELKKAEQVFKDTQVSIPVTDGSGQVTTVTFNAATAAAKIYDAIYNNDPFGWTEDETTIVNTLKQTPKAYIGSVEKAYKDLYKKNLRQDVIAALDQDEWEKVDYLFK